MIQLILLTLLAALLVLYTFFPAAWRALMTRDIEAYPYSSYARYSGYNKYGGYGRSGGGGAYGERGLVGVAMRHPFRASGPPACMAKLIMQRHKIHQSIARTNKSKKASPSSSPTHSSSPPRSPTHAKMQVQRPQIRVRIPTLPSMPTIRVPPPPTAPRLPMDPGMSSVDVAPISKHVGEVVERRTPPAPAPVLVPRPVHELSHPQPSLQPSCFTPASSLSPSCLTPSSTPLPLPLSSLIPTPLPLLSSPIPEHSSSHSQSPASASLPSHHSTPQLTSSLDSPRHTHLYPPNSSHSHSPTTITASGSFHRTSTISDASPAYMHAHANEPSANDTPVLPTPISTSPSIEKLIDTPINNARLSPRSFVQPVHDSSSDVPTNHSHEHTHRARDGFGALYPHDEKSRPHVHPHLHSNVHVHAHDGKHGYNLRLHGAPDTNSNSMNMNLDSWLTTSLSSLSLSIPVPSSPDPGLNTLNGKDYALNVRIKFTFAGAEKPFVFPFAQGLGRRTVVRVDGKSGRNSGRSRSRSRGRVLVVGKQYH